MSEDKKWSGRRIGKLIAVIFGAILIGAAGLLWGMDYWLTRKYRITNTEHERYLEAILPAYLEDQAALAKDPLFASIGSDRNAAAVLNTWITWEADGALENRIRVMREDLPEANQLQLDDKLTADVRDLGKEWITKRGEIDTTLFDFSWMSALRQYDHWDFVDAQPLQSIEPLDPMTMPVPNLLNLITWTKLRYMQAFDDGSFESASRDTRHLAALLYSTEDLLGAMMATAVLGYEDEAFIAAQAAGADTGTWSPVGKDRRDQIRRVVTMNNNYTRLYDDSPLRPKVRKYEDVPVGYCVALEESVGLELGMVDMLGEDYARNIRSLLAEVESGTHPCRLTRSKRILQQDPHVPSFLEDPSTDRMSQWPADCADAPFGRRLICRRAKTHIAGILRSIAIPGVGEGGYWERYGGKPPAPPE